MTARTKVTLAEVLLAIDNDSKEVWPGLTDEQKKKDISLFTLNRYLSSITKGTKDQIEDIIIYGNNLYNKDMYLLLTKHPQLLWQLACVATNGIKKPIKDGEYYDYKHKWISLKKQKDKKVEFLSNLFPLKKMSDIETLAAITTNKEIKEYCGQLGWDKKEIRKIKL